MPSKLARYVKLNDYSTVKYEMGFPLAVIAWIDMGIYQWPFLGYIIGQILFETEVEEPVNVKALDDLMLKTTGIAKITPDIVLTIT